MRQLSDLLISNEGLCGREERQEMVSGAHKEGDLWEDTLLDLNWVNGIGIYEKIKSHQVNALVASD